MAIILLVAELPASTIKPLQRIQNAAACLVFNLLVQSSPRLPPELPLNLFIYLSFVLPG